MNQKKYREIEAIVVGWHARSPHLSSNGRQWLANNVWWIVLIAAIAGAFGAVMLLLITLVGGVFVAGAVFLFSAKYGGLALLVATVVVTLTFANVVTAALAVSPLRMKRKKGWLLLALSLTLGFVAALLTDLLRQDEWAVIKEVIFYGIGVYVLLELREYFTPDASKREHFKV